MILDAIRCGKRNSKVDKIAPTLLAIKYFFSPFFFILNIFRNSKSKHLKDLRLKINPSFSTYIQAVWETLKLKRSQFKSKKIRCAFIFMYMSNWHGKLPKKSICLKLVVDYHLFFFFDFPFFLEVARGLGLLPTEDSEFEVVVVEQPP